MDAVQTTSGDPDLAEINGEFVEDDNPQPAGGAVDVSALAAAIVGAVNAAQGPRKIQPAEYMRERSVHRNKPLLTRKVYQNGYPLSRRQLSGDAIHLFNSIQPGIYADGMLTVVALRAGTKDVALDLRYQNKSMDERMALKARFPSIEHMLAAIVREQSDTITA